MHSPLHTQTKICVILNLILKTGITINYAILNAVNVKLNLVTDVSQRAFPTPMEVHCDPSLSKDILEKSFCLGWVFDNISWIIWEEKTPPSHRSVDKSVGAVL